jgi:SET and MYND domain-containing protein
LWWFVVFWVVGVGEELCISYLSGEERGMGRVKRRERLRATWGFECGCGRCEGANGEM